MDDTFGLTSKLHLPSNQWGEYFFVRMNMWTIEMNEGSGGPDPGPLAVHNLVHKPRPLALEVCQL